MSTPKCEKCDVALEFEATPNLVHYGKLICPKCGRFDRWVTSPNRTNAGRLETTKHKSLLEKAEYCSFCGRFRKELPKNETLTLHHSLPISEDGEDDPKNIIVLQRDRGLLYCKDAHKVIGPYLAILDVQH